MAFCFCIETNHECCCPWSCVHLIWPHTHLILITNDSSVVRWTWNSIRRHHHPSAWRLGLDRATAPSQLHAQPAWLWKITQTWNQRKRERDDSFFNCCVGRRRRRLSAQLTRPHCAPLQCTPLHSGSSPVIPWSLRDPAKRRRAPPLACSRLKRTHTNSCTIPSVCECSFLSDLYPLLSRHFVRCGWCIGGATHGFQFSVAMAIELESLVHVVSCYPTNQIRRWYLVGIDCRVAPSQICCSPSHCSDVTILRVAQILFATKLVSFGHCSHQTFKGLSSMRQFHLQNPTLPARRLHCRWVKTCSLRL
jgi:hypothetical protein